MKIALITSGLPRFMPDFIDLMSKLKGFECADIYMCLWKTDWATTSEEARAKIETILAPGYRLAKIKVVDEPPYQLPDHAFPLAPPAPENTTWWYKRIFAQFTGLTMAFDLIDQEYDAVIKFRVDGSLEQELDVRTLDLKTHPLLFPCNNGAGFDYCRISDLFFVGTQEAMRFTCSLSKEFRELVPAADPTWGDSDIVDGTWNWGTEHLIGFYMRKYNFPVAYGNFRATLNSFGRSKYTDRHYHHRIVADPTEINSKVLLLGDSHTDIFLGKPNVNRFDVRLCKQQAFTIHRFSDFDEVDLWSPLANWFEQNTTNSLTPCRTLVITGGEIDVRAHFWRHIPRHYQGKNSILSYVQSVAVRFYQSLVTVCEKYGIKKVVVWGAPVAGERAQYNSEHPFVGSSQTRNRLVHIWNREFIRIIENDPRISLATAYYNFIDPSNYSTVNPSPSHDGVHWHDSYGPVFWEKLIQSCIDGNKIAAGTNWNDMYNDQFDIVESTSQGTRQYDTWARTDQISNLDAIDRHIVINDQSYSWVRAENRNLLPSQYTEIVLQ